MKARSLLLHAPNCQPPSNSMCPCNCSGLRWVWVPLGRVHAWYDYYSSPFWHKWVGGLPSWPQCIWGLNFPILWILPIPYLVLTEARCVLRGYKRWLKWEPSHHKFYAACQLPSRGCAISSKLLFCFWINRLSEAIVLLGEGQRWGKRNVSSAIRFPDV